MPILTPYWEIADLLRQGRVIPFLGAGASLGNRPPRAKWDEHTSTFPPRGDELSLWLAKIINFPSKRSYDRRDLAKVAFYFAEMSARDRLLDRLRAVFRRKGYPPCPIHFLLAELAKSADIARLAEEGDETLFDEYREQSPDEYASAMAGGYKPLLIVTTNYDDLIETALQELDCPYDLVVHPTDQKDRAGSIMWWKHGSRHPEWLPPSQLAIDLETTTVVYKMHGTASDMMREFDSYVITEEDYVEFLSLMTGQGAIPHIFTAHFYERQFLFLGYGLQDWNLRVMLKNLGGFKSRQGKAPAADAAAAGGARERGELTSWAIQRGPSDLESFLWRARDVAIFDEDLNNFVLGLRKYISALVCHPSGRPK